MGLRPRLGDSRVVLSGVSVPKGPGTQEIGFKGRNTIILMALGALKLYYLGPWTLRVMEG